ncbi:MAG TPA: BamA/TamA family outer membrane protein [Polyangiaceae bacterium]|nr:BamA/TamA family outer membrane protein [Polyangiaceae bacterium]
MAVGLSLCAACGRGTQSTRPLVSGIDLRDTDDAHVVDDSAILDGLATSDEYDPSLLSRDLERVERYYRARGYYEAKVSAARVLQLDGRHVKIEIRVVPGAPVTVRSVEIPGLASLPTVVTKHVLQARTLKVDDVFDEARFDEMKAAMIEAQQDRGFPFAKVDAKAHIDLVEHRADVTLRLQPGPRATYGAVSIDGLKSIPEDKVRDTLNIREGQSYSRSDLASAQRALLNLGVFGTVELREDLTHPETQRVPIAVIVRESELRTVRLGGGADFNVLRLNLHLGMGWEHRNFLGGTRYLSISETPGVDFYPTRFDFDGKTSLKPTRLLLENSLRLKLRQPSFIESRTAGTIDASYTIMPVLYPLQGADATKERILGYHTISTALGLERQFYLSSSKSWPTVLTLATSYNWQANFPFTYQLDVPEGLTQVRVAFPALVTTLDVRDDPVQPHRGFYLSNTLQVADKVFGGTVSDVKIQPELRSYFPITKNSVTLASRLTMGFLIPRDYGDTLKSGTDERNQSFTNPEDPKVIADQQKLLLRAFYSGGANSNRGYPLRAVGPHGPVGFLIPTGVNCAPGQLNPDGSKASLSPSCIRPLGGFTLWEASLEVRFPLSGALGAVLFADASDVTREVGHIRLNVPHLSVGPGLRYLTPVGPFRLDVGYRVPGAQAIGTDLTNEGGTDVSNLFGVSWLPVAVNIALGEAF